MQARWTALSLMLCSFAFDGCAPDVLCEGGLYYDKTIAACRQCPKESTAKDGWCVCKESYEFVNNQCALIDSAVPPADAGPDDEGDSGSAAPPASGSDATCEDYCGVINVCLGMNALAMAVLSDVVTGLHADDESACKSSCESDVGGSGSSDPFIQCIGERSDTTTMTCKDGMPRDALSAGLGAIGECCGANQGNALCGSICTTLKANSTVSGMVMFCP